MHFPRPSLPALIFALLLPQPTFAIVSMEDIHLNQPREGLSGELEFSISGAAGNSERSDSSLGTRLQWRRGGRTDVLLVSGSYGESFGETYADRAFLHARHIQQLTEPVAWEAFAQAERDRFARLAFRGLGGAGVRWAALDNLDVGAVYLGAGGFWSRERLEDDYPDAGTETVRRANLYVVLKYRISPTGTIASSTYYQPDFDGADDYRLLEQLRLNVKMTERLSLVLAVDLTRDSRPPLGVEEDDVSYQTSVAYRF